MNPRNRQSGRSTSIVQGLLAGTLASIFITIVAAAVITKLIDGEALAWEQVGYGVMITLMTASFAGAWISYHKIKHQRLMVCLLSGAVYWIMLICITALFFAGSYEGIPAASMLILAGCACALLVTTPKAKHPAGKKYHIPHR